MALRVVAGLFLDGEHAGRGDGLEPIVGALTVGPRGLLADLELRLGLSADLPPHSLRVARYSARLAQLAGKGRFYSASYGVDSWGTSAALLGWRDELIEAGWAGDAIEGGERIAELAEIERAGDDALRVPPGPADRLRAVVELLASPSLRAPYAALALTEPQAVWPALWRRCFALLAQRGCELSARVTPPALAPAATDLGRVQRQILENGAAAPPVGDGSLVLLRGETTWETAHATAAWLKTFVNEQRPTVVIRSGDVVPLELAMAAHGLAGQGAASESRLRPLLQVLPLACELVFTPKDPLRVLELLALPDGPFRGLGGALFAEAIAEMPGLGSVAWESGIL